MMKTMFVDGSTSFGSCQYVPACTEWETLLRHSGSSRGICGRRLRRRGDTATFINRVYTPLIVSSLKNNLNVHGIWVVSPPGIDNTGSCTTSALCVYTLWDFETLTSASELEILYIFKKDFLFFSSRRLCRVQPSDVGQEDDVALRYISPLSALRVYQTVESSAFEYQHHHLGREVRERRQLNQSRFLIGVVSDGRSIINEAGGF